MIIYFLSEDVKRRSSLSIMSKAVCDARKGDVLIIPWTSKSKEKIERYNAILFDYFRDLGVASIDFAKLSDSQEMLAAKINKADLIYIPGGLPEVFLEYATEKGIASMLKSYHKVIVGNSAGALALCKDCVITKDEDHPTSEVLPGLGLVDFSVEVHYTQSKDAELMKLSKSREIYAIPDDCALIFRDGNLEFIGEVILFHNGEKVIFKKSLHFK